MRILNYADFSAEELTNWSLQALEKEWAVLIKGFPTELGLLKSYAKSLGNVSSKARSIGEVEAAVQEVREFSEPKKDPFGYNILSTSNRVFPLHTDHYCNEQACDYTGLHCVHSSEQGGESIFISLSEILDEISEAETIKLRESAFSSPRGKLSILYPLHGGGDGIRYNLKDILQCQETKTCVMDEATLDFLDIFEGKIRARANSMKLAVGDLWVVNNKKYLHGREAFPSGSHRLLRRFRIFKAAS